MRIAVIKLGSRISISSSGTSGGTGEALSIINMLLYSGHSVDVYTKVLEKDLTPKDFSIFNIEDTYSDAVNKDYDALVVMNGNVNYFGGVDDPAQTLNYYIINNFKGKVFYILCDCNLLLKQIWPLIEKKSWSSKYNKDDILITRNDIVYVSQPREINKVLELARKHINIKDCIHFPFEKFPLMNTNTTIFNKTPKYDLLYGGTFRNGRREDDMIKFYFGYNDYRVTMFGKIEEKHFNKNKTNNLKYPEFEKSVNYDKFIDKMNESIATVIIGDPLYKKLDDLAQRIYECIEAKTVVLIDSSYDFNRRVFKDEQLKDFCYVSNKEDVKDRLSRLQLPFFRHEILKLQSYDIYGEFNTTKYCDEFSNILERR